MNQTPSHQRQSVEHASPCKMHASSLSTCILSTLGIGVFGLGVGALSATYLKGSAALIALLGITIHLIALIHTARNKYRAPSTSQYWLTAIYGSCWIIFMILGLALFLRWFR